MFRLRAPHVPTIVAPRRVSVGALIGVGGVRVGASSADIASELAGLTSVDDVDAVYRKHMKSGDVPDYIATNGWWPGRVTIVGGGHVLEILVAPDYGAIGTDADPYRIGKSSQAFAQEYADNYNAILPSQKLLRDIEAQADPKIAFIPVQKGGGADDSIEAVTTANDKANAAFAKAGITAGSNLTIGYRKSYVVRPNLNGDYLAIYGGRWTSAGGLVQPTSGHAHTTGRIPGTPNYADYSHGLTLVSRKATLDGSPVDLRDVFLSKDPTVVALVSDEGSFDPTFPNAGSGGATGKYSYGEEGGGGGGGPTYTVSADVASVQQGLVDLGYDVGLGGADGKLGPTTQAAITQFRTDHGLPDGGVDQALADAINAALAAKYATASVATSYATPVAIGLGMILAVGIVWWVA